MKFDTSRGKMEHMKSEVPNRKLKAVIYCRVSSSRQVKEGNGLRSQEMTCRQWCEKQNPKIEVDKVFVEPGVSGSKSDRAQFNALVNYLEEKNRKYTEITHFVAYEHSRISRPDIPGEGLLMEERIKSLGTKVVSLDIPNLDDSTDEGMTNIKGSKFIIEKEKNFFNGWLQANKEQIALY